MECKALEERLIHEFADHVNLLKEDALKAAGSIRVLADISTVLMALWHPSVQKYMEHKMDKQTSIAQSYLDDTKHLPPLVKG